MSIERRVRKLEEAAGQGEPCPECGHIAGKPTSDTLNWEVYWDYTVGTIPAARSQRTSSALHAGRRLYST